MATYLARPCPHCNGYLGIVLREVQRNMPVGAVNGHCLNAVTGFLECHQREAGRLSFTSKPDFVPSNQ
jgi:hypothetical protein